jgi:hypothetical protein
MAGVQHSVPIWLLSGVEMRYRRTARHVVTAEECFAITAVLARELPCIETDNAARSEVLRGLKKKKNRETVLTLHKRPNGDKHAASIPSHPPTKP